MDIEKTSLWREISAIWSDGAKAVHFSWSAVLHPNQLGQDVPVLKVIEVSVDQDFENAYGDGIIVTLVLGGGTYSSMVYPYQDDLEITLTKSPLQEVADSSPDSGAPQSQRYRATLIDTGSPLVQGSRTKQLTNEEMNLANMITVKMQLFNKAFEQLRMVYVGTVVRQSRIDDCLKTILTAESAKLKLDDSWKFQGVNMVEASNPNVYEQIVIPQRIGLLELPVYLNKNCGGIYSAGLGYYLQGAYWYVYPCYDTTRFSKAKRTMSIMLVPEDKLGESDRTFLKRGSNVSVIAAGNIQFKTGQSAMQRSQGNGVRFADANQMVSGFVTTKDNKAIASRADTNSEFVSNTRADGMKFAPVSKNAVTANPFVEYSELAKRNGSRIQLVWNHSDPSLIYPDMMVRIYYLNQGTVRQLEGVLQKAHTFHQQRGVGITAGRFVTRTVMSIFVKEVSS